jgi:Calcineurin-like phosphoesterase
MPEISLTFRDRVLSIYQSAVADLARQMESERPPSAARAERDFGPSQATDIVRAAEQAAALRDRGRTDTHSVRPGGPAPAAMGPIDRARLCASLGLQYFEARIAGDESTAQKIKSELDDSTCDPRWASTLDAYLRYFGPHGNARPIPYIQPADVGNYTIPIKAGAKIALIGDWGTGGKPARRILTQVRQQQPDVVVHLGDIYYSGTDTECRSNFEAMVNEVLDPAHTAIKVYTLSGNHDMYSGGQGYYALLARLNDPAHRQRASFFCLRSADGLWQLLAMDTGLHDYQPLAVTDVVTFVSPAEEAWHRERLREFNGASILLSHHQLFSAFSQIGKPAANGKLLPYNPRLRDTFYRLRDEGKPIAAWFWGHEHNLCIYRPYGDFPRGRCLGHGAIPVFTKDEPYSPLAGVDNPPGTEPGTKLDVTDDVMAHGFASITLGAAGTRTRVEYFQDVGGAAKRLHAETLE